MRSGAIASHPRHINRAYFYCGFHRELFWVHGNVMLTMIYIFFCWFGGYVRHSIELASFCPDALANTVFSDYRSFRSMERDRPTDDGARAKFRWNAKARVFCHALFHPELKMEK